MDLIIIVLAISIITSSLAVALILRISNEYNWFDRICKRKIHSENIPRLAGIGFALAFFVVALVVRLFFTYAEFNILDLSHFFALLVILIFGIVDDFRPLKPLLKLSAQIVAALIVIVSGHTFGQITYIDAWIFPEPVWFVLTLVWIVGITNAINLIDGIDGLAGSVSGLIALFLGLIFFNYGNDFLIVLYCVAFAGVIVGFLFFNAPLPKAKIFMGDCGSQFFGFFLALLPLFNSQNGPATLPMLYVIALLLIPIFDTIAAIWRRIRDSHGVFTPDKSHTHHKLMNLGLSVRGVVLVLGGLQIILGVLVFVSIRLDGLLSLYVLGFAYLLIMVFFTTLHYRNRRLRKKLNVIPPSPPPPPPPPPTSVLA
ncbi:MAG: undecaprenyl/decaprenyl-phosphate alpha-N-acetylglucosaminyl 1-phosphate transferase [Treponema sp.]|jgi:UDP-GlcNAc:undecaprenyl-phosphate GlcNAc-1-phosphate transferase|nr:undecaprenyl/decaprenyl-phosphate alpha-N-acetylglucosaminyl 1-phosphate transferase [Treponema sp.]